MADECRDSIVDGLTMRPSGEWAREKLYYVGRYMDIVATGMKSKWGERGYLDLMAGPGRCFVRETLEEFDGSPVIATNLETPFDRLVFIEADANNARALDLRTAAAGSRRVLIPGDCNDPETIATARRALPNSMLSLAFVDLLGMDVPFSTIAALTDNRKMDLVITFQVSDITRNVPLALGGSTQLATIQQARLDAFFGAPGWRDVAARFDRAETGRAHMATALADYYGERLRTIGYVVFEQLNQLMRNNNNAPLYRMLLAGKHERAADFFRKISAITPYGQRSLLF